MGLLPADEQFVRFADNALDLNGASTYVDLGNPDALNLRAGSPSRPGLTRRPLRGYGTSWPTATATPGEVYLRIVNGQYQVGSWDGTDHVAVGGNVGDDVGRWTHLCGVYDGAAWILYRNGLEIGRSAPTTGAVAVNAPWAIGAKGGGGERFFQGQFRHVAIWN